MRATGLTIVHAASVFGPQMDCGETTEIALAEGGVKRGIAA
jgi:hypothetical protein